MKVLHLDCSYISDINSRH